MDDEPLCELMGGSLSRQRLAGVAADHLKHDDDANHHGREFRNESCEWGFLRDFCISAERTARRRHYDDQLEREADSGT